MSSDPTPQVQPTRAPLIVHELPGAPTFVGREEELTALRSFYQTGSGVLSLVGIGGAGKTAVLQQFLDEVLVNNDYDGILVWSFYDDPDTNAFLRTAVEYVLGRKTTEASGTGWFHALKQALDGGGRFLFILDGLERVQRSFTDAQGIYGELEDALLRGFLVRLVSGAGRSQAVITSRFPVSDIDRWVGRGYSLVDIDQLDQSTAFHILRSHGVQGEPDAFAKLTKGYGRHALTVDLLGAAIARFFGGTASNTPDMPTVRGEEPEQVTRLAAVLTFYQEHLSAQELDLMSRLCVFRFGVTLESLGDVFLKESPAAGNLAGADQAQLEEWVDILVGTHLVHREAGDKLTVHPAVRDHFYRIFRDATSIHGAISEHLLSLSERPGIGLPTAKESLDLLEELVYHALKAGRENDAIDIFGYRMGGNEHLNVNLGEYARTYRILSAFPHCPDPGAMYYSLRAFGEFEEALKWRPQNHYIRIANGRLEELRENPSEATRRAVRFLMGESGRVPERMADFPISAAHLHLLANSIDDAEEAAMHEIKVALFQDDVVRGELALAEVARRRNQATLSRKRLDETSQWVLRAGSHEHLFFMFLYRARLENDLGEFRAAQSTLEEAIHIVEESSFDLFGVEAQAEMARTHLFAGRYDEALIWAGRAGEDASEMKFVWGEMIARHIQAEAAAKSGEAGRPHAQHALRRLLELQRLVNDPTSNRTEIALKRLEI